MNFEKIYKIIKWTDWSQKLSESIDDFYSNFSFYPNIIEANEHTYSQFDFLTNEQLKERNKVIKRNDITSKEEKPSLNDDIRISEYKNSKTTLEFAVGINLKDKEFKLVYDSEPDWAEDDIIVDLPVEEFEKVKI